MIPIVALLFVHLVATASDQIPPALRRFHEARARIQKADIEWNRSDPLSRYSSGATKKKRSLVAGKDIALFNHGIDGVTAWTEEGDPVVDPVHYLSTDDEKWEFHANTMYADYWDAKSPPTPDSTPEPPTDIRTLGMTPSPDFEVPLDKVLHHGDHNQRPDNFQFVEHRVGDRFEVTRSSPGSPSTVVWTIDPALGWNATSCKIVNNGKVLGECVTDYQQVDGVWFPVTASFLNSAGDAYASIEVTSARIDDSLPDSLLPEHVGMGNGIAVLAHNGRFKGQNVTLANNRVCSFEEAAELRKAGKLAPFQPLVDWSNRVLARSGFVAIPDADDPNGPAAVKPLEGAPATHPSVEIDPAVPKQPDDDWER